MPGTESPYCGAHAPDGGPRDRRVHRRPGARHEHLLALRHRGWFDWAGASDGRAQCAARASPPSRGRGEGCLCGDLPGDPEKALPPPTMGRRRRPVGREQGSHPQHSPAPLCESHEPW
eukprot:g2585.t1